MVFDHDHCCQATERLIKAGHSADLACILEYAQRELDAIARSGDVEAIREVDMISECVLPSMNKVVHHDEAIVTQGTLQVGWVLPRWKRPRGKRKLQVPLHSCQCSV